MVKRTELEAKIKEKILLMGDSGVGKTYTCTKIAKLVAGAGKKVVYIDPEYGAERELEGLTDAELEMIELKIVPRWEMIKPAIEANDDCFLKIVDGISEVFDASMHYLEQRFLAQGKYVVGDKEQVIHDKETFVLPFVSYPKVYEDVKIACTKLIEQKPHILCTAHPFGSSDARQRLAESIYRRFDTVLDLRIQTTSIPVPSSSYVALCKKHRGAKVGGGAVVKDHVTQLENLFKKRLGIEVKECHSP